VHVIARSLGALRSQQCMHLSCHQPYRHHHVYARKPCDVVKNLCNVQKPSRESCTTRIVPSGAFHRPASFATPLPEQTRRHGCKDSAQESHAKGQYSGSSAEEGGRSNHACRLGEEVTSKQWQEQAQAPEHAQWQHHGIFQEG
jgi:hypothetical protein